ncbi:winged helix-turn-helix domain-containing protein [Paenibacillus filicis]|uniref:Winged helix-turn-helix domain-containing protein n=1 Tax=Paenibacillus gyeongsangnamensis TaxID=3388067 RepID=A0ABT4QKM9_9BACL|nr:winged helix-turn-helix domain-containing protein [Paenibacillus filicis]MCZ8517400.1 winged helix-turn-helix domain-containing protein [Paenibacillus filicis]
MQSYGSAGELSSGPALNGMLHEEQEGPSCCRLTQRVVIISPTPAALHELIRELTARCYDVLVLHRPDPETIRSLRTELVIVDRTHDGEAPEDPAGASSFLPTLHLLAENAGRRPDAYNDFYLNWPVPVAEMVGHIRRLTQLNPGSASRVDGQKRLKDLTVDVKRMAVYRGGSRIELTKTEFELLRHLLDASGTVLTRQELMDHVWGEHYFGGSNTVDVHLKSLRQKLGDNPKVPRYIATVRGVGYRIFDEATS